MIPKRAAQSILSPRNKSVNPSSATTRKTSSPCARMASSSSTDTSGRTFRYPIAWKDPDFYNEKKLEEEMRRVFDVCHGCRLCYSLCDSFPTLFDMIDESKTGELDSVDSKHFKKVVDSCTLCDVCFMSKCPYVPPHGLNVDFPHLMLRYRAVENKNANTQGVTLETPTGFASVTESTGSKLNKNEKIHVEKETKRELAKTPQNPLHALYTNVDFMGSVATQLPWLFNFVTQEPTGQVSSTMRRLLSQVFDIHERADLPKYVAASETFVRKAKSHPVTTNQSAKAFGKKKVVLFATCIVNYHKPDIGAAAREVLAHNGVEVKVEYPMCCGMPQLEAGKVNDVTARAEKISAKMKKYIDDGYDIVTPTASCSLMIKKEWPLLAPLNKDIQALADKSYDISEYIIKISKENGLAEGLSAIDGTVTLHHACHSRAQANGFKSQEMLQLIPQIQVASIERCSGHGGSFGVQNEGHKLAMKVGKHVFSNTARNVKETPADKSHFISSDCPLAMDHIKHGVTEKHASEISDKRVVPKHPIQIFADAYGLKYHSP